MSPTVVSGLRVLYISILVCEYVLWIFPIFVTLQPDRELSTDWAYFFLSSETLLTSELENSLRQPGESKRDRQ